MDEQQNDTVFIRLIERAFDMFVFVQYCICLKFIICMMVMIRAIFKIFKHFTCFIYKYT